MTRSSAAIIFAAVIGVAGLSLASAQAQDAATLTGGWTLNHQLSQFPSDVGFGIAWLPTGGSDSGTGASGQGQGRRRGSGGVQTNAFTRLPESEDEAARLQQLTADVREPAAHLTIADTPEAVTITDGRGRSRTFHPNGREETLQLDGVPVTVIAKRTAGALEIFYEVEDKRELRYVYSRVASPPQLVVETQFLDHGKGDTIRRVYEPASSTETIDAATAPAAAKRDAVAAAATGASASAPGMPAAGGVAGEKINQKPDAALEGLTELSVNVGGLSAQASTCGLSQDALEAAVSKHLADAGLKVIQYSNKDTYLNVNVNTTSLPNGLCVSRYDVSLDTETTAKLSYQQTPVLVQVSLLREGGLAGSGASTHAAEVLRGVLADVDQFTARIRSASK